MIEFNIKGFNQRMQQPSYRNGILRGMSPELRSKFETTQHITNKQTNKQMEVNKMLKVPIDKKQQMIIRQNVLGHATKLISDNLVESFKAEDTAKKIIEIAKLFESYVKE